MGLPHVIPCLECLEPHKCGFLLLPPEKAQQLHRKVDDHRNEGQDQVEGEGLVAGTPMRELKEESSKRPHHAAKPIATKAVPKTRLATA